MGSGSMNFAERKVVERAWEIARMIKSLPRETRTIMSHLCKRPLEKLLVDDLKIHTLSEQYSTIYRIAQKDYGEAQVDEKDMSAVHHYRYTRGEMSGYSSRSEVGMISVTMFRSGQKNMDL